MTDKLVRQILDACFMAKKITEMAPELPKGMKPRHIHVVAAIKSCKEESNLVCVTDISNFLNITTPSVTKLINELLNMEIVEKIQCKEDKRLTYLELTQYGENIYIKYVYEYHNKLAILFDDIKDDDVATFIRTTEEIYNLMSKNT